MATFEQAKYCPNCKKNVSADKNDKCSICGGKIERGTWSTRFRIVEYNGVKQKRLSGFNTKKEAQQAYAEFITNYKPYKEISSKKLIFNDVLTEYLQNCNIDNTDGTIYEKERIFEKYITPYFDKKDITTITKPDLMKWQTYIWTLTNERTKQKYTWKYLIKLRGTFNNFLSYCENIYDVQNYFRTIKAPKNKDVKKEIIFWEIEEFNSFINTIDDIFWRSAWYTFMFTGARLNEIRALSNDDITETTIINKALSRKTTKLEKYESFRIKGTKNHKLVTKQTPEVLQNVMKEFKSYKKKENLSPKFLLGDEKPISEKRISRRLDNDITNYNNTHEIKLKRITPHGFRHSYVSLLIHIGISTKVIAELIGDTEEQVIKTYGHLYSNAKDLAINLLDNRLKI